MTSTTTKSKPAAKAAASKQKQKSATIYIGPRIKSLGKNTVFKGGELMPHVKKLCEECPAINQLIVPVAELGAKQARLGDSTSAEFSFYKKIEKHFRKGA